MSPMSPGDLTLREYGCDLFGTQQYWQSRRPGRFSMFVGSYCTSDYFLAIRADGPEKDHSYRAEYQCLFRGTSDVRTALINIESCSHVVVPFHDRRWSNVPGLRYRGRLLSTTVWDEQLARRLILRLRTSMRHAVRSGLPIYICTYAIGNSRSPHLCETLRKSWSIWSRNRPTR